MASRPAHLTAENAARFQDHSVVDRYHLRLPYPPTIFDILVELIVDEPRAVLDAGTGTGDLARQLVSRVDRVDAVDISAAMMARGRTLPGGDHAQLHWILGAVEDVPLRPPYALITAGDSLHWMDWETVFPRFAAACSPRGFVAIVRRIDLAPPWQQGLLRLIQRFSTMRNYQPFNLIDEVEQRGLFRQVGRYETARFDAAQSVEDYIASCHSRSSLSYDRMPPGDAAAFDQQLRELVAPWSRRGVLDLQTAGSVVWGRPLVPGMVSATT